VAVKLTWSFSPKEVARVDKLPQAAVNSDSRWVASNYRTTSSAKGRPPEVREGEGEAGRGEEGTTGAISWEVKANPSDEPATMAMVTLEATKPTAAPSPRNLVSSATASPIERSEP